MSLKFALLGSPSMSLKFTAMGRLPILSALETNGRADDQAQNLGLASTPRLQARHVATADTKPSTFRRNSHRRLLGRGELTLLENTGKNNGTVEDRGAHPGWSVVSPPDF